MLSAQACDWPALSHDLSPRLFRILALEKLGAVFNQVAFPLQYTPRKFVIHPETNNLVLIESDHNAYTEATKAQRKQQMAEVWRVSAGGPGAASSHQLTLFVSAASVGDGGGSR